MQCSLHYVQFTGFVGNNPPKCFAGFLVQPTQVAGQSGVHWTGQQHAKA